MTEYWYIDREQRDTDEMVKRHFGSPHNPDNAKADAELDVRKDGEA